MSTVEAVSEKHLLNQGLHKSLVVEAILAKRPDVMRTVEAFCDGCGFVFDGQVVNDTVLYLQRYRQQEAIHRFGVVRPLCQQLGWEAFQRNLSVPCLDRGMMFYLREFTSGEVGTGAKPLKQWWVGWFLAQDQSAC